MCVCDQVTELDKEGVNIKKILGGLFIIELFVVFAKIILVQSDCLIGILGVSLVIITYLSCHYILAVCVTFVFMGNLLMTLFFILQRVQNSMNKLPDQFLADNFYMTILVIEAISIIVDAVIISVAFSAYKNFKNAFNQALYSKLYIAYFM